MNGYTWRKNEHVSVTKRDKTRRTILDRFSCDNPLIGWERGAICSNQSNRSKVKRNAVTKFANRPLPSSKKPHCQNEARCTTFLVKMSFICMRMKNDFHIKGWAPTLVLKQRPGRTRKWSIDNAFCYRHQSFPTDWLAPWHYLKFSFPPAIRVFSFDQDQLSRWEWELICCHCVVRRRHGSNFWKERKP